MAAGLLQAKFASYDEDGNSIWEPDAKNVDYPMCDCSTLELISTEGWVTTMDGYVALFVQILFADTANVDLSLLRTNSLTPSQ